MMPREFSIASSPSLDSGPSNKISVDLCVAVKRGTTKYGKKWVGACSRFLRDGLDADADAQEGQSDKKSVSWAKNREKLPQAAVEFGDFVKVNMPVWIRRGSFSKVAQLEVSRPVMCVGAGTGIAPLRGILRERSFIKSMKESEGGATAPDVLVFGCRKKNADNYYDEEWDKLSFPPSVHHALSQESAQRVYVQNVLQRKAESVAKHLLLDR